MNEINKKTININPNWKYQESYPTISAYTTVYNCIEGKYPFEEAIRSFIDFDEVVVVDGGSTDGTRQRLEELSKEFKNLKVYDIPLDKTNPGCDGAQKAVSRAMCFSQFCIQFDADEVCSKDSVYKFKKLAKFMPPEVNMYNLPVYEFIGPKENWNLRTDRHVWKWRLSRNLPEISHGIPSHDRLEKDGKVFSKGLSDGCFPINVINNELIQGVFPNNWFNKDFDSLRTNGNFEEYKNACEKVFSELPFVYHYSWCDVEHKLRMLRGSWNELWCGLYGRDPLSTEASKEYFNVPWSQVSDEMIKDKAEQILKQGGQTPSNPIKLVLR